MLGKRVRIPCVHDRVSHTPVLSIHLCGRARWHPGVPPLNAAAGKRSAQFPGAPNYFLGVQWSPTINYKALGSMDDRMNHSSINQLNKGLSDEFCWLDYRTEWSLERFAYFTEFFSSPWSPHWLFHSILSSAQAWTFPIPWPALLFLYLHALQMSNILHHLLTMFLVYHLSYPTCPPPLECPLPKGKTLF